MTSTLSRARPAMDFRFDLAISAVTSDAGLVTELVNELATRLPTAPVWQTDVPEPDREVATPLVAERSRLALVLHHDLWEHDDHTRSDASLLRDRLRDRPGSVCVMTFDDAPVPGWLSKAPRYDVAANGRAGATTFVLDAIELAGGSVGVEPVAVEAEPRSRWPEPPPPFLSQPRAHSALRHEFDALIAEIEPMLDSRRAGAPDGKFELQVLPHRLIARMNDVAITFSWVAGRLPTVGDGSLLVIAWRDVAPGVSGIAALKSAAPVYERTYNVEGSDAGRWRWRARDSSSRSYSTRNLAAEWLARASLAKG